MATAGSVDGLVEASRQSRVCGGAANEIMCAIFRVLMEVCHMLSCGLCHRGCLLHTCNSHDGCFCECCVCHLHTLTRANSFVLCMSFDRCSQVSSALCSTSYCAGCPLGMPANKFMSMTKQRLQLTCTRSVTCYMLQS